MSLRSLLSFNFKINLLLFIETCVQLIMCASTSQSIVRI